MTEILGASTSPARAGANRQSGSDGEIAEASTALTSPAPPIVSPIPALRAYLLAELDFLAATDDLTVDELAVAHQQLTGIAGDLKTFQRAIDSRVMDAAQRKKATYQTPIGEVAVKMGMKRNDWQSEDLLHSIIWRTYAEDTARPVPEILEAIETEIRACAPFTSSLGWRTKALKEREYRPSDWCNEQPNALTVQWPRSDR